MNSKSKLYINCSEISVNYINQCMATIKVKE